MTDDDNKHLSLYLSAFFDISALNLSPNELQILFLRYCLRMGQKQLP
jgi:hypothetical protein